MGFPRKSDEICIKCKHTTCQKNTGASNNSYEFLQIRTMFGFVLTHPPTSQSKHSRYCRVLWMTLSLTAIHEKNSWLKSQKRFKEIMNKNSISGCTYFFLTGNPNTWFPKNPPTYPNPNIVQICKSIQIIGCSLTELNISISTMVEPYFSLKWIY